MTFDVAVRTRAAATAVTLLALAVVLLSPGPASCQDSGIPDDLDVRGEIDAFMSALVDTSDTTDVEAPPPPEEVDLDEEAAPEPVGDPFEGSEASTDSTDAGAAVVTPDGPDLVAPAWTAADTARVDEPPAAADTASTDEPLDATTDIPEADEP
jgi:hypothetical protein